MRTAPDHVPKGKFAETILLGLLLEVTQVGHKHTAGEAFDGQT
jgi:hypothetical protein